jgi:hypothetical protein
MLFQGKKEACGNHGAGGFAGNEVYAGKRALRRQEKEIVLSSLMKNEEQVMIGPLDHFVHPRSGKEGSEFIDDLYKDIKVQSAVLSERIISVGS